MLDTYSLNMKIYVRYKKIIIVVVKIRTKRKYKTRKETRFSWMRMKRIPKNRKVERNEKDKGRRALIRGFQKGLIYHLH